MKYCTDCGTTLQDGLSFCTECGAKQSDAVKSEQVPIQQQSHRQAPVEKPVKKPMSKRTKIIASIVAGLCIVLFGAHQFLTSYFDPMKQLQAMDSAVSDNNIDEFINYIDFDDAAILDKESYAQYIMENEWGSVREKYMGILEGQQQQPSPLDKKIEGRKGSTLFTIKQNPALLGIYTDYSLVAMPSKLHISTTIDKTEVKISDLSQKIKTTDTSEVAKIYPGEHAVTGKAKNIFGEFAYEDTLEVGSSEEYHLDVDFGGKTFTLSDTEYSDAALLLDGKDSGKKLGDFEYLGPFPEDSDMKLHAEWENVNGEVIKSDPFKPQEADMFMYGPLFSFDDSNMDEDEETKTASSSRVDHDAAGDVVLDFRDAYEDAVNSKDFSLIDSFLENGSAVDKELSTYIDELKDTAYHHDFTSNTILDVEEVDDNTVKVTTNELFTFTNHKGKETDYDREKLYTLTTSGDSYKITKIDYTETNRDKQ